MATRREIMLSGAGALGGALIANLANTKAVAQVDKADQVKKPADVAGDNEKYHSWNKTYSGLPANVKPLPPGLPGKDYQPITIPNGKSLPFKIVNGVKVFHIIAREMWHEFAPGIKAQCWGYNDHVNSTVLEAVEGERIRIYVTNRIPAPTTIHWHGIYLPNGMDGVSGLTQRKIDPGETYMYEFTLRQHGTYMFHSHHDTMTQEGMGLIGSMIIHPRNPHKDHKVDRDFTIMLSEWAIETGTSRPNTMEMSDFNILTMNGKSFPGTEALVVRTGQRVRIRFGNLSAMDHHPIHLHGYYFKITATDGERIPASAQWPETTTLVAVGQTRDVEFIADTPGDWIMHCHMTHHIMNQMGHEFPNMVGMEVGDLDEKVRPLLPGYMTMGQIGMTGMAEMKMPVPKNSIPMLGTPGPFSYFGAGGMFTVVKVRDKISDADLAANKDPGWYKHPPGTVATRALPADLKRDGISLNG